MSARASTHHRAPAYAVTLGARRIAAFTGLLTARRSRYGALVLLVFSPAARCRWARWGRRCTRPRSPRSCAGWSRRARRAAGAPRDGRAVLAEITDAGRELVKGRRPATWSPPTSLGALDDGDLQRLGAAPTGAEAARGLLVVHRRRLGGRPRAAPGLRVLHRRAVQASRSPDRLRPGSPDDDRHGVRLPARSATTHQSDPATFFLPPQRPALSVGLRPRPSRRRGDGSWSPTPGGCARPRCCTTCLEMEPRPRRRVECDGLRRDWDLLTQQLLLPAPRRRPEPAAGCSLWVAHLRPTVPRPDRRRRSRERPADLALGGSRRGRGNQRNAPVTRCKRVSFSQQIERKPNTARAPRKPRPRLAQFSWTSTILSMTESASRPLAGPLRAVPRPESDFRRSAGPRGGAGVRHRRPRVARQFPVHPRLYPTGYAAGPDDPAVLRVSATPSRPTSATAG